MQPIIMHTLVEISRYVAQAFIAGLWQGLVLVSVVALLLRLAPGLCAAARYVIWWFTFALGTMVPLLHWPASAILVSTPSAQLRIETGWAVAIAAVWSTFTAIRAAQLLTQAKHLHRIWKRAVPITADARIGSLLRELSPSTQLCTSDDIASPSVIGFFSPRLLIPAWLFVKLTPWELEQIVLHESEHLRRHDDWVNLLQKIGLVLFPLNPALFWMDRRLSLERELACDAGVIASTKSRFDYARCLTRLAEHRLMHRTVALSLSAWGRRSELAYRIQHLLRPTGRMSQWRARFSSALIYAGLIIGGIGMAGSPHLVSFTEGAPVTQAADTVTLPANMRPIPVGYRSNTDAHPLLLKTVAMPVKAHRALHKASARAHFRNLDATTKQPRAQLILTTLTLLTDRFNGDGPVSLPALPPPSAAVQFENGWLVIQL